MSVKTEKILYEERQIRISQTKARLQKSFNHARALFLAWYAEYAIGGSLSISDARRRLTWREMKRHGLKGRRPTRLEYIEGLMHEETDRGFKRATDDLTDLFTDTYKTAGKLTAKEIGVKYTPPTSKEIQKDLKTPWAPDELTYEQRLKQQATTTRGTIDKTILMTLTAGLAATTVTDALDKLAKTGTNRVQRIANTDAPAFATQAEKAEYEKGGIEYYRFVAVIDDRTTDICMSLDGEVFPVEDEMPGVNAPPMHDNCRSSTEPVRDENEA